MRILFVTYDFSRTGAPMVLAHFVRWLNEHHRDLTFDIVSVYDKGDMKHAFTHAGQIFSLNEFNGDKERIRTQILDRFKTGRRKKNFWRFVGEQAYDCIYANTISTLPLAGKLKRTLGIPLLMHLHEASVVVRNLMPDFKQRSREIDRYIVPSRLLRDMLVSEYDMPEEIISVIPECARVETNAADKEDPTVLLVGGSGTVHWRKGPDLFIQTALQFRKKYDLKVKFIWTGLISEKERFIYEEDLRKSGLTGLVEFEGEVERPGKRFRQLDLFLMTSREDPFPLVCIEAGMLGIPIICFNGATGMQDVEAPNLFDVPYLDCVCMADKAYELLTSRQKFNGEAFSMFDPETICPAYLDVVTNIKSSNQ